MPRAQNAVDRSVLLASLLVFCATSLRPSARVTPSAGSAGAAEKPAAQATVKPASAATPDIPFGDYDQESERILLDLANQARKQAGAPSLRLDAGLSRAARIHAEAMVAAHQLSHQFNGEPTLPQRLAEASQIQLDQEGENVAFDLNAAAGHKHLMLSPPHRANLLNAAYNVIGLGVVRSGDRLYIVQDFGHALPKYSASEVKDRILATVTRARHQAKQSDLVRHDLAAADAAACSMAQADRLGTSPVQQIAERYTVLTYTSLHPETLPANAGPVLTSRSLRNISVGACYARTETYPTGVYWVVLSLD